MWKPYPYFSFDEHVAWLTGLQQRLRQQGIRPLDFYRIDPDWIAFPPDRTPDHWLDLKALGTKIDEQRVAIQRHPMGIGHSEPRLPSKRDILVLRRDAPGTKYEAREYRRSTVRYRGLAAVACDDRT